MEMIAQLLSAGDILQISIIAIGEQFAEIVVESKRINKSLS
jgi:hypothetical protein